MTFIKRRYPQYSPASDASLTLWLDPSDSTKLLNTGGGAIANGNTIGTWNTSGGAAARAFTQWGTQSRPSWNSTGINGLGAVSSTAQILSTTTVTGFASMSGLTVLMIFKQTASVASSCAFSMTEIDNNTGQYDISLVQMRTQGNYEVGGRRTTSDAFVTVVGNAYPSSTQFIESAVFDYSNAKLSLFESGVKGLQQQTFQTAGTTGAGEPHVISIGGVAQQTGNSMFANCNGLIGEILAWNTAKTPDQLVAPHSYLRRKWKIL